MERLRVAFLLGVAAAAAALSAVAGHAFASSSKSRSLTGTISVVYSESYEFDAKSSLRLVNQRQAEF